MKIGILIRHRILMMGLMSLIGIVLFLCFSFGHPEL